MKLLLLASVIGGAVAVSACHPRPETAVQTGRLDCPESEGELTRRAQAPDGRSCTYVSGEGATVELRLMQVTGSARETLNQLETELAGLAPATAPPAVAGTQSADSETAALAQQAAAQARADAHGDGETTTPPVGDNGASSDWDPGPGGEHEEVKIDLPGLSIDARENAANIKIGPVHIDASDTGATVRLFREVRMKGEALSREKRGVRATYILAGGRQPGAYDFVGYEAGGPKDGPLVVAVVTAASSPEEGGMIDEVQTLVRRNAGV